MGNSDNTQSLINQNGIRAAVIDYTENYPNTNDGMFAPTGFETNLILNKQDIEFLDGQYSDCIKDLSSSSSFKFNRSFYDVLSSSNVSYQQRRCIELCYQEVAIQNCSCNDLTYNNLSNINEIDEDILEEVEQEQTDQDDIKNEKVVKLLKPAKIVELYTVKKHFKIIKYLKN